MMRLHATVCKSTSSSARLSLQELSLCGQYVTERSLKHLVICPLFTETNKGNLGTKANEPKSRRVRLDLKLTNRRTEHGFSGGKLPPTFIVPAKQKQSNWLLDNHSYFHVLSIPAYVFISWFYGELYAVPLHYE